MVPCRFFIHACVVVVVVVFDFKKNISIELIK